MTQPSSQPLLSIRHITRKFGQMTAVNDVSLDIQRGEIFALLGSSGCGKSTLLRMLAGFETPTSGEILLEGESIVELEPYKRPINMMFQSYALFPHMNVWDNIAFGLRRDNLPKNEIKERVEEMLRITRLEPYASRKPHQLSGGQQQRVALARSLAKRPKLLLLDEPLGALDKKLREHTQIELLKILHQVNATCVMVTHDQEEAMTMANRIAIMSEGVFLQVGSPKEIYEWPNCKFVADFIGNVNLFEGEIVEDSSSHAMVKTPDGLIRIGHGVTGNVGMSLSLAIRPEKMMVNKAAAEASSHAQNSVNGVVDSVAYFGGHTAFHIKLPSGKVIRTLQLNDNRYGECPEYGHAVSITWEEDSVVVLYN